IVVVDNTFASPALQTPIALGADVVVHSATKYLGGHSDVLGGVAVTASEELGEKIQFLQFAAGGVSAPWEVFLTIRGIKTLALRMDRPGATAAAVAGAPVGHRSMGRVYVPAPLAPPAHVLAAWQMGCFGGMVSWGLPGGVAASGKFAESTS